jgi:hypothetical protein
LEYANPGVLHQSLAVDLDGFTRLLCRDEPEIFRAKFLLQGCKVCLDAPAGAAVDQGEAVTIVNTSAGGRT